VKPVYHTRQKVVKLFAVAARADPGRHNDNSIKDGQKWALAREDDIFFLL
jgi:hypothetical protein